MNKTVDRFQSLQDNIKQWSDKTFGSHRTGTPITHHLKKEIDEVLDALSKLREVECLIDGEEELIKARSRVKFELADCFTLLLDVAAHENINVVELIDTSEVKMEINKKRIWGVPDENGVVEHIENNMTQEFEHKFIGNGIHPSKCLVRIYIDDGDIFICFVDMGIGTSVTNTSEQLAMEIVNKHRFLPKDCRFFETYEGSPELDEIEYKWWGNMGSWVATEPQWECDIDDNIVKLFITNAKKI